MFYNLAIMLLCVTSLSACNSVSPQETVKSGHSHSAFVGKKNLTDAGLLIQFHKNISDQQARRIIIEQQSKVIRRLPTHGLYHIQTPPKLTTAEAVLVMKNLPEVRFVEPNVQRQRSF